MLLVNYSNSNIISHDYNNITKNQIIEAGLSGGYLYQKVANMYFMVIYFQLTPTEISKL